MAHDRKAELVHIKLVNFSGEIVLPMATVIGVAEEVSSSLLAAIHAERDAREGTYVYTVADETKFREYVNQVLGYLPKQDRDVLEPVLRKYRNLFHLYEDSPFPGTVLEEHRIVTGDARRIRKAPYRVPFVLREEMESQVRDMLHKGVIEPSSSPWAAPAMLVPKKSADAKPKYRFCVGFRALNKITQFDNYLLPIFD